MKTKKVKKAVGKILVVALLLGAWVISVIVMLNWHNTQMEDLQKQSDAAIHAAQESDQRAKEIEKSLNELAKNNKNLESRIETITINRDTWITTAKKYKQRLEEAIAVKDTVIESAEIEHKIQEIYELAVKEYKYRHTSLIDEHDNFDIILLNGKKIPFTHKRLVISMDGTIKIGVNVDKVTVKTDNSSKKITISLPKSVVLSHELDENSMYVYLEEDSVFNRLNAEDNSNLRQKMKDEALELAKKNGIFEEADVRVKQLIQTMLEQNPDVKSHYKIDFKTVE